MTIRNFPRVPYARIANRLRQVFPSGVLIKKSYGRRDPNNKRSGTISSTSQFTFHGYIKESKVERGEDILVGVGTSTIKIARDTVLGVEQGVRPEKEDEIRMNQQTYRIVEILDTTSQVFWECICDYVPIPGTVTLAGLSVYSDQYSAQYFKG